MVGVVTILFMLVVSFLMLTSNEKWMHQFRQQCTKCGILKMLEDMENGHD